MLISSISPNSPLLLPTFGQTQPDSAKNGKKEKLKF